MTTTPKDINVDAGAATVPDPGSVPGSGPARATELDLKEDEMVGHFFVIRRIGRGGMGEVLFEMLAGRLPYGDQDLARLTLAVTAPAAAPRLDEDGAGQDVPQAVVDLVARCMDKDPSRRPSARELSRDLAELLDPTPGTAAMEGSPFRGLLPFTEEQAAVFFGRESEIAAVVERLRLHPLVTVVGPSGAGKSSLVQAGVIPRLREQERRGRILDVFNR